MKNEIVIDATDVSLGRVASFAAKQALLGRSVIITNCNEAIISGRKASTLKHYQEARARRSFIQKGPNFPTIPERIVKRTIRGMLPYKKGKGLEAYKRTLCYNETPKKYESSEKTRLQKDLKTRFLSLKELSQRI